MVKLQAHWNPSKDASWNDQVLLRLREKIETGDLSGAADRIRQAKVDLVVVSGAEAGDIFAKDN